MNIDKFLESKVIPDVVQRATLYAVRTLESVENEYTKPYDEAVHLFRKCGKTKKEAYEMTGLL